MFHGWENFFFMIGSAAGGLIGLLFVVVTLTSGLDRSRAQRGQTIYMTPTMLHFAAVLTSGAAALVPGLSAPVTAAIFGIIALVGLGNAGRAWVQMVWPMEGLQPPHWSDAWFYGAIPAAVYVALAGAAGGLCAEAKWAVYATAALLLALLLIGIRNAWDLVTWMAPQGNLATPPPAAPDPPA